MRSVKQIVPALLLTAAVLAADNDAPRRLVARAFGDTPIFEDLKDLCDRVGGRPTGSPAAVRAIEWGARRFQSTGVDRVWLEPFKIPNLWLPGTAEASVTAPEQFTLRLAAAPFPASPSGHRKTDAFDPGDGAG